LPEFSNNLEREKERINHQISPWLCIVEQIRDQIDCKLLKYRDLFDSKWLNTETNFID
jgi:hypothetical protein